jgi:hypothetical protein
MFFGSSQSDQESDQEPDQNYFAGRTAVLATMHQKQRVIAPLLWEAFGLAVTVPEDFDTDQFGTFTRDIARIGSQLNAARTKAKAVFSQTNTELAIASEGAFAPHPLIPFVAANTELVLLVDRVHDLEIYGTYTTPQTNYAQQTITTWAEAEAFAQRVQFPSHGLVIQNDGKIIKGICDPEVLRDTVTELLRKFPQVQLETDMRAMHNPTRMKAIAAATEDLIRKLQSQCPQCHTPGFTITERISGLICGGCGRPTQFAQAALYTCSKCDHQAKIPYPDGKVMADPMYCDYCNP